MLSLRHFGSKPATVAVFIFKCSVQPKAGGMLKVSIRQVDSTETWELEGKLSGDWVKELERCWRGRRLPADPLRLYLKAVSYIDASGKQLLSEMHGRGVEIRGCGCMTKALVEEITRQASPGAN